jgi:hypothetical protein
MGEAIYPTFLGDSLMTTTIPKFRSSSSTAKAPRNPLQSEAQQETSKTPEETFESSGDQKASAWESFTPIGKVGFAAISGWWGLVLGGSALLASTALAPVVAGGIGLTTGVAVGQAITRISKSDKTKAEVQSDKEKRALEPSSWKTAGIAEKAMALGVSGWLGLSVVGGILAMSGALPPVAALAVGTGVGAAVGAGTLVFSKDSDRSASSDRDDDRSSGLALTSDGKLGFNLGGGVVLGSDGKVGFGFEL